MQAAQRYPLIIDFLVFCIGVSLQADTRMEAMAGDFRKMFMTQLTTTSLPISAKPLTGMKQKSAQANRKPMTNIF